MNRKDLMEFGETVEMIAREFAVNGVIVGSRREDGVKRPTEAAARLCALAKRLTNIAVANCNDGGNAKRDARCERLKAKVYDLLLILNREAVDNGSLRASCDGDPRGYVLKLKLPSGRSNELGGDWGIPPL